jgi:hypothetical protein
MSSSHCPYWLVSSCAGVSQAGHSDSVLEVDAHRRAYGPSRPDAFILILPYGLQRRSIKDTWHYRLLTRRARSHARTKRSPYSVFSAILSPSQNVQPWFVPVFPYCATDRTRRGESEIHGWYCEYSYYPNYIIIIREACSLNMKWP